MSVFVDAGAEDCLCLLEMSINLPVPSNPDLSAEREFLLRSKTGRSLIHASWCCNTLLPFQITWQFAASELDMHDSAMPWSI